MQNTLLGTHQGERLERRLLVLNDRSIEAIIVLQQPGVRSSCNMQRRAASCSAYEVDYDSILTQFLHNGDDMTSRDLMSRMASWRRILRATARVHQGQLEMWLMSLMPPQLLRTT